MLTQAVILVPIFSCLALSQTAKIEHPWDAFFQKSVKAWSQGDFSGRKTFAEQGWSTIQRAGPSATDYAAGVESAYRVLEDGAGTLAAEAAYRDALAATANAAYRPVHLELLLRRGTLMLERRREVNAARAYREALELEQTMPSHTAFYGFTLVALAAVTEKLGDPPAETEKLYRRAATLPPHTGTSFRFPQLFSRFPEEKTKDWQDFELALTRFLTRSGRFDEAEQIHKARIARAGGSDRASRLRDYVLFLRRINRDAETFPVYQQVIEIDKSDASVEGRAALRSDLAAWIKRECARVNSAAAESLFDDLVKVRDSGGSEYESAVHEYADALLFSGHLDIAGKVIDEEISAADRKTLQAAMWHKVRWLRMKGDESSAKQIEQRITTLSPAYEGKPDERDTRARRFVSDTLQLINQDQYEAAKRKVDQLLHMIETGEATPRPGSLEELASSFGKKNRKQEGSEILERQLGMNERSNGPDSPAMIDALLSTAYLYYNDLGMTERGMALLSRASALALALHGEVSTQMENIYLSKWTLLKDREESASWEAQKWLDVSARMHGANSERVLDIELDIAPKLHSWTDAAPHWHHAVEISRRPGDGRNGRHAQVLRQAAYTMAKNGQFEAAFGYIQEGSAMAKSLQDAALAEMFADQQAQIEKMQLHH